jgi:hypothetical protein
MSPSGLAFQDAVTATTAACSVEALKSRKTASAAKTLSKDTGLGRVKVAVGVFVIMRSVPLRPIRASVKPRDQKRVRRAISPIAAILYG